MVNNVFPIANRPSASNSDHDAVTKGPESAVATETVILYNWWRKGYTI